MAIKIGLNAPKFASKNDLNFFVGQRVAAVRKALREAYDARQLLAQLSIADIEAVGFTNGEPILDGQGQPTGQTQPAEVNYLLGAIKCAAALYELSKNIVPTEVPAPHDYDAEMRYVAGTDN